MISWLMIVLTNTDRSDCDRAMAVNQSALVPELGTVTWNGKEASIRSKTGDLSSVAPGSHITTAAGALVFLEGHIEAPPPPQRSKLRLPGSGIPYALLLVQDSSFRGCFFSLGEEPCWLGLGASVQADAQGSVVLLSGSAAIVVSGHPVEANAQHPLVDSDVVTVGERKYQVRMLPKRGNIT